MKMSKKLKAMLIDAAIRFESEQLASLESKSTSPSELRKDSQGV